MELPVWFRPIGFRLYAWAFGCNIDEADQDDLTQYVSLGDFFYRKLKDGVRPVADTVLVCPSICCVHPNVRLTLRPSCRIG